ncbi:MAG: hypothetical protein WAV45_17120 [Propionibacteriaceae bacterium]|nr:hypothetical protein [Micropruina sp.]
MSIVALTTASGAPGCTTTAVGLALRWPTPVLLADANRDPAQAILSGYLRGQDVGRRGFSGLLQAHRERRPLDSVLESQCVPLDDSGQRMFLPGVAHPAAAELFVHAWPDLLVALEDRPTDTLLDCGRMGREGLPTPIVEAADAVLVVCRASLVSLAGLRLYLPLVTEAVDPARVGLLVVGPGRPYSASEIAKQFGVSVWGSIAHDPVGAQVYSEGDDPPKRFAGSAYVRSLTDAADGLVTRFTQARRLIGVAR